MLKQCVAMSLLTMLVACTSSPGIKADSRYLSTDLVKTIQKEKGDSLPDSVSLEPNQSSQDINPLPVSASKKIAWKKLAAYFDAEHIPVLASDQDLGVYFVRANAIQIEGHALAQGLLQFKLSYDDKQHLGLSLLDIADQPFESEFKAAFVTTLEQVLSE